MKKNTKPNNEKSAGKKNGCCYTHVEKLQQRTLNLQRTYYQMLQIDVCDSQINFGISFILSHTIARKCGRFSTFVFINIAVVQYKENTSKRAQFDSSILTCDLHMIERTAEESNLTFRHWASSI
jgi:hypothetical protein